MKACPVCGVEEDNRAKSLSGNGKLVDVCSCGYEFHDADDAAPVIEPHKASSLAPPAAPLPSMGPRVAPVRGGEPPSLDLIRDQARARLSFLEAEIARRKSFDIEARDLRRLLAARRSSGPHPDALPEGTKDNSCKPVPSASGPESRPIGGAPPAGPRTSSSTSPRKRRTESS